mmetsp:Transcript_116244/g.237724  ORF Transcript_116244/g.237724 Transcript_116244/m.237724 type:complete len:210 (+) Transcript_116244:1375-2004(+)
MVMSRVLRVFPSRLFFRRVFPVLVLFALGFLGVVAFQQAHVEGAKGLSLEGGLLGGLPVRRGGGASIGVVVGLAIGLRRRNRLVVAGSGLFSLWRHSFFSFFLSLRDLSSVASVVSNRCSCCCCCCCDCCCDCCWSCCCCCSTVILCCVDRVESLSVLWGICRVGVNSVEDDDDDDSSSSNKPRTVAISLFSEKERVSDRGNCTGRRSN